MQLTQRNHCLFLRPKIAVRVVIGLFHKVTFGFAGITPNIAFKYCESAVSRTGNFILLATCMEIF